MPAPRTSSKTRPSHGEELAARASQQRAVAELGRESLAGLTVKEMGPRAVRALADGLALESAALFRASDGSFALAAGHGCGGLSDGRAAVPPACRLAVAECFATGETSCVGGTLCVRVMAGKNPWGVLCGHDRSRRAFSSHDLSYAQALANIVGEAIERLERLSELEAAVETLKDSMSIAGIAPVEFDAAASRLLPSPEFLKLHGLSDAEQVAALEDYWQLVHPLDRAKVQDWTEGILRGGDRFSFEYRILLPDGSSRWVVAAGRVARDERGRPLRVRGIMRDVTSERGAAEADALRRRDAQQREFMANVSHEFRTPLAAIQGFAETLLDGALEDRRNRKGFVRSILEHANRLSRLVEDLLDLSALEGRALELRLEDVALAPLARTLARDLEPVARRAGVELVVSVPDELFVRADEAQLLRVMVNLVSNGVAYNRRGGLVTVSASEHENQAAIGVRDTGCGIAHEQLERLFQRFHRAPGAKARKRGSGLGLAISRGIVEAHGGRIWAESVPGQGSTFRFTLPLARPALRAA